MMVILFLEKCWKSPVETGGGGLDYSWYRMLEDTDDVINLSLIIRFIMKYMDYNIGSTKNKLKKVLETLKLSEFDR